MARIKRLHSNRIRPLFFLIALVLTPSLAFGQGTSRNIPENSHPKKYGSGWECDQGYRKIDQTCEALNIPANAYPSDSSYGRRGWECERGYKRLDETCAAINLPPDAYLDVTKVIPEMQPWL